MRRHLVLSLLFSFTLLAISTLLLAFGLRSEPVALAALPAGHPLPDSTTNIQAATTISTTLNDLFIPGSQPGSMNHAFPSAENCTTCHLNYNDEPDEETWFTWGGSMMAQSARDPVFWAALDIANVDAEDAGAFCLRCHTPQGFLEGRVTTATDGSALTDVDLEGVQCSVCHRLVDPIYEMENPARDVDIIAAISPPVTVPGNGGLIVDPDDERRGPFVLEDDWEFNPHAGANWPLYSPYHQESLLCASCHQVSNPLLSWNDATQQYELNDLDSPAPDMTQLFPIESTYDEWRLSDYALPGGVYAPQFGGNLEFVSSCQDCHMRDVTGAGGAYFGNQRVIREDMPLHDLTGANTWVPTMLPLHPEFGSYFSEPGREYRADALLAGIERARYMLENAASIRAIRVDNQLMVTVTNESGHKLPTGYPEGRRMWIQVEGYDSDGVLVYTSGAYNAATGELAGYGSDPTLQVFEMKQGLTTDWAALLGLPAGPSFHFMLNNYTEKDNRIPPRGFVYSEFAAANAQPYTAGAPDPSLYADGQYWSTTHYTLPDNVYNGVVRLLYQTSSKEYIEFLRDNNPNQADPDNNGAILFDLWELTGMSPPEIMAETLFWNSTFLPAAPRAP